MHFIEDGANLTNADLSMSQLDFARLGAVIFKNTTLTGSHFWDAEILECMFVDCDLTDARGLDRARYLGYSTVDLRTPLDDRRTFR